MNHQHFVWCMTKLHHLMQTPQEHTPLVFFYHCVLCYPYWGLLGLCSSQTGHAIILLKARCMTNSLAHNRMPEWTRNLISHCQTSVSSSLASLEKFKHKSVEKRKSRDTVSCLCNLNHQNNKTKCLPSNRKWQRLKIWEVKTEQGMATWHERDEQETPAVSQSGWFF